MPTWLIIISSFSHPFVPEYGCGFVWEKFGTMQPALNKVRKGNQSSVTSGMVQISHEISV